MRALLLVSLALAPISALASQRPPTGTIEGIITAPAGIPLANALVVLMGHPLATLSSDFGVFRFCAVPAGSYDVRITWVGYRGVVLPDMPVKPGQMVRMMVTLRKQNLDSTYTTRYHLLDHPDTTYLAERLPCRPGQKPGTIPPPSVHPPDPVLRGGEAALRRLLGDSIFDLRVAPLTEWSIHAPVFKDCERPEFECSWPWFTEYYVLFYQFSAQSIPPAQSVIIVPVDTLGNLIKGFPVMGAPPCGSDPTLCEFPVSADSALRIATPYGEGTPASGSPSFGWTELPRIGGCERCWDYFPTLQLRNERAAYSWAIMFRHSESCHTVVYVDARSGEVIDATTHLHGRPYADPAQASPQRKSVDAEPRLQ